MEDKKEKVEANDLGMDVHLKDFLETIHRYEKSTKKHFYLVMTSVGSSRN
jgi:hypothetical protein